MKLLKVAQDAVKKVNKSLSERPMFTREMVIGDRVIHTVSGIRGEIEGIQVSGGTTLLTIRTPSGQVLNKLARQEFRLCSDMQEAPVPPSISTSTPAPVNEAPATQPEPEHPVEK